MKISNGLFYFIQDKKANNLAKRSIEWYQSHFKQWVIYCGDVETESITPHQLREYLIELGKTHNEGGVHGYYRAIKAYLNFYEEEFEPENWKNPIKKIKPPRVDVEPIEGIEVQTVKDMIEHCSKSTFNGVRDHTIISILLETGVRASELININVEDIDFSDSSILIRKSKSRKPRYVFIGATVRRRLRKYLKYTTDSGALFVTNTGSRLTYSGLRQIIKRLSDKVGLPEQGIHSFRRTFALSQLRAGVNLEAIKKLGGWSSLDVLARYLKLDKNDIQKSYKSVFDR